MIQQLPHLLCCYINISFFSLLFPDELLWAAVHQLHQWEATAAVQPHHVYPWTRGVPARGHWVEIHWLRPRSPAYNRLAGEGLLTSYHISRSGCNSSLLLNAQNGKIVVSLQLSSCFSFHYKRMQCLTMKADNTNQHVLFSRIGSRNVRKSSLLINIHQ